MIPRTGRYYGRSFQTGQGVTQGDLVYPTIFNIVVDAVVRETLREVCGPQEALHGLGWKVGEHYIVFYAYGVRISARNPIWAHVMLMILMHMFDWVIFT